MENRSLQMDSKERRRQRKDILDARFSNRNVRQRVPPSNIMNTPQSSRPNDGEAAQPFSDLNMVHDNAPPSREHRRQRREILDARHSHRNVIQRLPLSNIKNTPRSSTENSDSVLPHISQVNLGQENISPLSSTLATSNSLTFLPNSSRTITPASRFVGSSGKTMQSTLLSGRSRQCSTINSNVAGPSSSRKTTYMDAARTLDFDLDLDPSGTQPEPNPASTCYAYPNTGSHFTVLPDPSTIASTGTTTRSLPRRMTDINLRSQPTIVDPQSNEPHLDDYVQDQPTPTVTNLTTPILIGDSKHSRRFFQPLEWGGPTYECPKCGAMMWYQERLRKDHNSRNPKFGLCCKQGKVILPPLQDPPQPLKSLLEFGGDPRGPKFRKDMRSYNCSLAFTSNGGKIDRSINNGGGPPIFKINGLNHHKMGSLLPVNGEPPKFSQLYIFDTDNEVENRIKSINGHGRVDSALLQELIRMLESYNPLCQVYRMVRDRVNSGTNINVKLTLIGTRSKDARQYNLPTASEVAALVVAGDAKKHTQRDIIVEMRSGRLLDISEIHPLYMPAQYPLIFPRGEDGYHSDISFSDGRGIEKEPKLSQADWFCYRIQFRRNQFNTILRCGRLTQQFFCDAWTSVLGERATYILCNQKRFRMHILSGLEDAVVRGDHNGDAAGKRIILPSSFTGGPRHMVQTYQDAMAIVRSFGPPDLFLTFTCNPKWSEIEQGLTQIEGLSKEDRLDLISRVFKMKLDHLMIDLTKNNHFGRSRGAVYTVEFQKRGLPHAHIALFLEPSFKPKDVNDVDRMISAELPDKDADPIGFNAVSQFMIHGPCGGGFPTSSCMVDRKCEKHYPKKFQPRTTLSGDGFPVYMRRDNGRTIKVKGVELDNTWVVPHNVDLVVRYNAHINVELCNQSRCIKYLFKYICKGEDRATLLIEENLSVNDKTGEVKMVPVNELNRYLTCTYFGGCESMWRIFKFPTTYRDPSVERLRYHLPNEQVIVFDDDDDIEEVINKPGVEKTMLTQWFKANQTYADARGLSYIDFPTKFVWKTDIKEWRPRKKGRSVGRLFYAHPSCGERFYLRILLNEVKGATSFEDLRTVDSVLYDTYKEACKARGLLQGDYEWHETMREASIWASGDQLRALFVVILLFCEVVDVKQFWERNAEVLSEDILHKKRESLRRPDLVMSPEDIRQYALLEIEKIMYKNCKSLRDFKTMPYPIVVNNVDERNSLIMEEIYPDRIGLARQHRELFQCLNSEQRVVYDAIIDSVHSGRGGFFFVYGSGGTGKTFLWKTICCRLRSEGKIVLAVASSGIAALLIDGGRTAHSRFKIPISIDEHSSCSVFQGTPLALLLRSTSLVIWDEAPMANRVAFEAVDRMLRDIMRSTNPDAPNRVFGGLPFVLGGDFRQILPVVPKGKRGDIVSASVSRSEIWKYCQIFTLTVNMRVRDSASDRIADFSDWLLRLGEGRLPVVRDTFDDPDPCTIEIPEQFLIPKGSNPVKQIIEYTYPNLLTNYRIKSFLEDRAILSPTNEVVDTVNDYVLSLLPGEGTTYLSADRISPGSGNLEELSLLYPIEFLNSLKFTGVPNHSLHLKEGVPIILLRNINQNVGLCNGTRLIVTKLHSRIIQAEIITGRYKGDRHFIPKVEITPSDTKWPFQFVRRQFPIKVCFAMTINKSQGQTFKNVGVYLPRPVFTHGQLYVAASRVTSPEGFKILIDHGESSTSNTTENVVYKEIFNDVHGRFTSHHTLKNTILSNFETVTMNKFGPTKEQKQELLAIKELTTRTKKKAIKCRLTRLWEVYKKDGEYQGISIILLDENNDHIHAFIYKEANVERHRTKLQVGKVYIIFDFIVKVAKDIYKPVSNPLNISFKSLTSIKEVTDGDDGIKLYKFEFATFDQLKARANQTGLLSDVIGIITKIGDIHTITTERGPTLRLKLGIRDDSGHSMDVTLWGHVAEMIDPSTIKQNPGSTIVVLTSMLINMYNGGPSLSSTFGSFVYLNLEIEEAKSLFQSFPDTQVTVLDYGTPASGSRSADRGMSNNRINIEPLKALVQSEHPQTSKHTVQAWFKELDTGENWYYEACPIHKRKVKEILGGYSCDSCGSATVIPVKRYKMQCTIEDESGELDVVMFDEPAKQIIKKEATEIFDTLNTENGIDNVREMYESLKGTIYVFQIDITSYNLTYKDDPLTVGRIWELPKMQSSFSDVLDIAETPAKRPRLENRSDNL